ncbi:MAG: hypothetical protein KJ871_05135 [Alphaproteobacteria bacterium]|nr:hypothetical protein [Alphaproteobacteria bacterium]MBU2082535.1 hypothetical protein [Alphaproteobacteria bacterium]MBU2142825.1 hypothetical protein [Alphaproteobacteria bacterium]MBU2195247.1 hypothetical protein [Alphaproteobacteria bacterium]
MNGMTEAAGSKPYEQSPEPRKSRKVYWIVGSLILSAIVLGTCINGGMKAYKAVSARNTATDALVRQFLTDGLPPATDPIYSRRIEITQKAVDDTDRYIRLYGAVTEYGAPGCTVRSAANTEAAKSGTFGDCAMSVVSEKSPGRVTVQWVREDDDWKVIGFNVAYSDQSVLLDKAEQADEFLLEPDQPVAPSEPDAATED